MIRHCRRTSDAIAGLCLAILLTASVAPAQPSGFRTTNALYPDAEAPMNWSKSENVLWHTPLPAWSNACPVLSGDRIFLCAEPDTLICLNRDNGRLLWQRSTTYADAVDDPARQEALRKEQGRLQKLAKELHKKEDELGRLERKLRKDSDNPELKAQEKELKQAIANLKNDAGDLADYVPPATHDTNGYTSATPATNGKVVVAVFSTGLATAFDTEGNRLWVRRLDPSPHKWGTCASPVIAGDSVVIQIEKTWALDLATGKVKWSLERPWSWGTPAITSIGDTQVIFTPRGDAIRLEDGHLLAEGLAGRKGLDFNCPVIQDGRIYYIYDKAVAWDLPDKVGDKLQATKAWQCELRRGRYYATPVIHDGYIYALHQSRSLAIIDAQTGKKMVETKTDLSRGTGYPSPVVAGDHIFLSSDNGQTVVIKPGPTYEKVRINELEPFRTTPVLDGNRLYIRAESGLYCFSNN